jgi:hypothetical protein
MSSRKTAEETFPVAACERLVRSEYDYYSTHGEYIRPLAFLLNETRRERDAAVELAAAWLNDAKGVPMEQARTEILAALARD